LYLGSFPLRSTVTLTALPAMSLIPFAPLLLVIGEMTGDKERGARSGLELRNRRFEGDIE
jgi:hypothetical protein